MGTGCPGRWCRHPWRCSRTMDMRDMVYGHGGHGLGWNWWSSNLIDSAIPLPMMNNMISSDYDSKQELTLIVGPWLKYCCLFCTLFILLWWPTRKGTFTFLATCKIYKIIITSSKTLQLTFDFTEVDLLSWKTYSLSISGCRAQHEYLKKLQCLEIIYLAI